MPDRRIARIATGALVDETDYSLPALPAYITRYRNPRPRRRHRWIAQTDRRRDYDRAKDQWNRRCLLISVNIRRQPNT